MDDATTARQMAGDYITRSEAQQGDATSSITGAVAGGLLGATMVGCDFWRSNGDQNGG